MKRQRIIIGISLIALVIGAAGGYFGAHGQYFGKNVWAHVGFVMLAIAGVSLLFLASEWYNAAKKP